MSEQFDPEAFFRQVDDSATEPKPNGTAGFYDGALQPVNPISLAGVPVPARQWLVPDWVPMARATALYGAGGDGKTLIAQMLATACAIGEPWLGLQVRRCRSLLLFCEDDLAEMHRRQEDINRHYGCDFADLDAMRWLPRLGDNNALMTFDGRPKHTPLFGQLLAAAKEHDAKLVITDTLADVFSGNENDRGQVRAFVQSTLGLLARETDGGAVLALAHPSRTGINSGSGESGSTAWDGTVRSRCYLSTPKTEQGEPPDTDLRVLTRKKSNWAKRDETIDLRWRDGVFVTLQPPTGILGTIERRTCERVFLDLLDKLTAEGQRVSHNSRTGNYAPRVFSMRPERERFAKADFERAMQRLFAEQQIAVGSYKGSNRHEHECVVRAA